MPVDTVGLHEMFDPHLTFQNGIIVHILLQYFLVELMQFSIVPTGFQVQGLQI